MNRKIISVGFAAAMSLAAFSSVSAVAPDDSNNPKKDYVCHFTASEKNPVVIINVGNAAVNAHTVDPSHGHEGNDRSSNDRPTSIAGCTGERPGE